MKIYWHSILSCRGKFYLLLYTNNKQLISFGEDSFVLNLHTYARARTTHTHTRAHFPFPLSFLFSYFFTIKKLLSSS